MRRSRPLDKYALRRRAEQQERRRAGLPRPVIPECPRKVPASQRYAQTLLPVLGRLKSIADLYAHRTDLWSHDQDLIVVRALAEGYSATQAADRVREIRPTVTSNAVARRIRVLWKQYGRRDANA